MTGDFPGKPGSAPDPASWPAPAVSATPSSHGSRPRDCGELVRSSLEGAGCMPWGHRWWRPPLHVAGVRRRVSSRVIGAQGPSGGAGGRNLPVPKTPTVWRLGSGSRRSTAKFKQERRTRFPSAALDATGGPSAPRTACPGFRESARLRPCFPHRSRFPRPPPALCGRPAAQPISHRVARGPSGVEVSTMSVPG